MLSSIARPPRGVVPSGGRGGATHCQLGVATHLNVHVSPECYAANYADGRIALG